MYVQVYWKVPNLERSFLKINYPMIEKYVWNFYMYLFFQYLIQLTSHQDVVCKTRLDSNWFKMFVRNNIIIFLHWSIIGRFMSICIFIFLQFELYNKSLKSVIQILTLSGRNVFYFSSGWKCELFILIRQILWLSMVIIDSIVKIEGAVVDNILKSHLLYWYQFNALFFKGKKSCYMVVYVRSNEVPQE